MKGTSLLQRLTKSVPRKSGLIQLYLPLQAPLGPGLLLSAPLTPQPPCTSAFHLSEYHEPLLSIHCHCHSPSCVS